jgi:hypothetical protein
MMSLVDAAKVVSESQVPLQEALSGTITKYEELLTAVNNAYKAMTQPVDPAISPESPDPPKDNTSGTNNTASNPSTTSGTTSTSTIIVPPSNFNNTLSITPPQSVPLVTKPISPILPPVAPPVVGGVTGMHPGMMIGGGFNRRLLTSVAMMDTGGYTGEWGPEGKIAMLHEKELVLNSDDTSNFLSALGLLDNILLTLDKYTVNA